MLDLDCLGHDIAIQLVLPALKLQVADQHPGQGAAQEQAHGHDAGGGRQEAKSETQVSISSRRYPTPQTVWMLGSVMLAPASFSRTCCT